MLGLVDGNSFFVSCERVFDPRLHGIPVIVLSSNDGCVIARSDEAKRLDIAMGEPAFRIRHLIDRGRVAVRSANFALYADLSRRMMQVLADQVIACAPYSIDEAFVELGAGEADALTAHGQRLRSAVRRWTGIPTAVGIAETKTLAKLANRAAKRAGGVCVVPPPGPHRAAWLRGWPVEEVWGVGARTAAALRELGIADALALTLADDAALRARLGVVGLRIALELRGEACLPFAPAPAPRAMITVSRSFGERVDELAEAQRAVAAFAEAAAANLRQDGSAAGALVAWLEPAWTATVRPLPRSVRRAFAVPTDSTPEIVAAARAALARAWQPGLRYAKAGVTLVDLVAAIGVQQELFAARDRVRERRLMAVCDAVAARHGAAGLRTAAALAPDEARWRARHARRSPAFTTDWAQLPVVG